MLMLSSKHNVGFHSAAKTAILIKSQILVVMSHDGPSKADDEPW